MNVKQMRKKKAQLVREAEALRSQDGTFVDDAARAAFDAKTTEIEALDAKIRAAEAAEDDDADETGPAAATAAVRAEAIEAERTRGEAIRHAVGVAKLADGDKRASEWIKKGTDINEVRRLILEDLATRSDATSTTSHRVEVGDGQREKYLRGAEAWLIQKAGKGDLLRQAAAARPDIAEFKVDANPGEFRGATLMDLARQALDRHGVAVRGIDRLSIAGQAMGYRANYQTTSDFATLLENTMHKVLRAAYAVQTDTWSRFCGIGTVSDFRAHNWYRMGALSQFDSLTQHGEFTNKAIPAGEKTSYSAETTGNIIAVTREVIVNDDIGFVLRLVEMLGRAGKLTIEKAVYTQLLLNSGLGPTQTDTNPLFHSGRANVNASATAITVAGIQADVAVLRSQMDPSSQEYLDLQPAVLLVPISKDGDAKTINDSQYDPADSKFMKPNTVRGLFRDVVSTPRLSGNRRYIFADPTTAPVFLVSFLDGQREPVLETQDGWRVDGVEMKGRLDFGVDVVDYRGAVTNAGA
jgi:hypothetical protein